jgi:hypothetical protein
MPPCSSAGSELTRRPFGAQWADGVHGPQRFDVETLCRYDANPTAEQTVMSEAESAAKRATVYFEPALHRAIRLKAAHTHRSISEIVNDAVRLSLREDEEDLAAFEDRVAEPVISYEALLKDLKAHGKL